LNRNAILLLKRVDDFLTDIQQLVAAKTPVE